MELASNRNVFIFVPRGKIFRILLLSTARWTNRKVYI